MRPLLLILLTLASAPAWPNPSASMHELLQQVLEERRLEGARNAERMRRFDAAREMQRSLLAEAERELAALRTQGEKLAAEQRQLAEREQERKTEGPWVELNRLQQAILRSARKLEEQLGGSLVSVELGDRGPGIQETVAEEGIPAPEQVEALWQLQLEEMVETGRVTRFQGNIITSSGEQVETLITRVGPFNLIADGSYLRYLPSAGQLVAPGRQPPPRYREMASMLESANGGNHPIAIDPTRGNLLQLLARTPTLSERIEEGISQGGLIGGIILAIGSVGILLALGRLVGLIRLDRRIHLQLGAADPDPANPLGRILQVYVSNPQVDTETLELKLDEAILKELPRIRWGLGSLSVMAAIAPLLGLLGTVTGIIETFQSITLHGSGDPRIMSGGISQALVTTVEGLVVAIPLMLLHSFLSSHSNRVIQILDEQSAAMVARRAEQRFESRHG